MSSRDQFNCKESASSRRRRAGSPPLQTPLSRVSSEELRPHVNFPSCARALNLESINSTLVLHAIAPPSASARGSPAGRPRPGARPSHASLSLCFCTPPRRLAPALRSSSRVTLIRFRPCRLTNSAKLRRRSRRRLKSAMRSCRVPPGCPPRSALGWSAACCGNSTPGFCCKCAGRAVSQSSWTGANDRRAHEPC